MAAFALIGMPAGGQAPAPPCPAGTQIPPERFDFSAEDVAGATHSVAATHPVELFVYVPNSSQLSVSDPAIQLAGPPGLQTSVANRGEPTQLYADFVPTIPGTLGFTATWTQLAQADGPACTASASTALTVTAPTPVRASRTLGYSFGHRPGKAGGTNEFVLTALVTSDASRGDKSPIRLAVRAVTRARRPSARTPVASLTLDPVHIPSHGARASTPLLRLTAGQFADEASTYQFKVGVLAYPRHGRGRAHRGVEMILSQGSRTLATYRYVTSCDSAFGGLQCIPLPKGASAP